MRDSDYPQVAYKGNSKQLVNEPSPTNDPDPQLVLKKGKSYPPQFFGISSRVFAIISILIFLDVGAGEISNVSRYYSGLLPSSNWRRCRRGHLHTALQQQTQRPS